MKQVQQKVYLLTEQQRDALLNYLLNRPYREVAAGVEFLNNAPTTIFNIELPEEKVDSIPGQEQSQSPLKAAEESKVEVVNSPQEEFSVFSHT